MANSTRFTAMGKFQEHKKSKGRKNLITNQINRGKRKSQKMTAHQSITISLIIEKRKKYRTDSHSIHPQIKTNHTLESTTMDKLKRRPEEANKERYKQNGRRLK